MQPKSNDVSVTEYRGAKCSRIARKRRIGHGKGCLHTQSAAGLCVLYPKTPTNAESECTLRRKGSPCAKCSRIVRFVPQNTQNGESDCNLRGKGLGCRGRGERKGREGKGAREEKNTQTFAKRPNPGCSCSARKRDCIESAAGEGKRLPLQLLMRFRLEAAA